MNEPNTLEQFCDEVNLDPVEAMNLLCEAGKCSDNCVELKDINETDCISCIKYLDGIIG